MTPQALPHRHRAPAGDIPVRDWQGQALDCGSCPHQALQRQGGCEPGHSCMQDAYARRIDRFFHQHPGLASGHLAHPYFEVRAIAARHADLFHLSALRHDPDETVRMQVALRLPQRLLATMCGDPHREVRIRVAQRLAESDLGRMLHDPDEAVRGVIARRLPLALLPMLASDADEEVRRIAAQRLQMPALWRLASDPSARVRRIVAERAPQPLLHHLAADADWSVRWEVAQRLNPLAQGEALQRLAADPDPEVRAMAAERLAASPWPAGVRPHG
jgi:LRV protein FeS4 cluster/Leucine rich repeat variant